MAGRVLSRFISHQFSASKNYYKTLGVAANATAVEIKKAYHDLARVYHPDAKTGNESKFKDIAEAFEVLSDEKVRSQYDLTRNSPKPKSDFYQQDYKKRNPYQAADPFSQSYQSRSPHEQASREEKFRKAAEMHERWKQASRQSAYMDFSAWSQKAGRYKHTVHPDKETNRPEEAWIYELMAMGVLLTLAYWMVKTLYAMTKLSEKGPIEVVVRHENVFNSEKKGSLKEDFGPVTKARVTRSQWQDSSRSG